MIRYLFARAVVAPFAGGRPRSTARGGTCTWGPSTRRRKLHACLTRYAVARIQILDLAWVSHLHVLSPFQPTLCHRLHHRCLHPPPPPPTAPHTPDAAPWIKLFHVFLQLAFMPASCGPAAPSTPFALTPTPRPHGPSLAPGGPSRPGLPSQAQLPLRGLCGTQRGACHGREAGGPRARGAQGAHR